MDKLTTEDILGAIRDARRNMRELIMDLPCIPSDMREGMLEAENLAVTLNEKQMEIRWWNETGNVVQKHTAILRTTPPSDALMED